MKDYVSIKEFAELSGKSRQAVYKGLNNQLKPFVKLVDNKKMVNIKALKEVYGIEVEQPSQHNCKPNSQPEFNQIESDIIALLKAELEAKNKQIEQLQKLLDQEQQLRMISDKRILMLEEKSSDTEENTPAAAFIPEEKVMEPEQKKSGFFTRIFKR